LECDIYATYPGIVIFMQHSKKLVI